jgi:serine/threonine protein kinase
MDLPDQPQSALGSTYALERELGRGGMATVCLAQDLRHERPERFLAEIHVTANLQHSAAAERIAEVKPDVWLADSPRRSGW